MSSHTIAHWLEERGLLLCAFRWNELPEAVSELIENATPDIAPTEFTHSTRLLLLANAGPKFWRNLQGSSFKGHRDPVDTFSVELAAEFQRQFLNTDRFIQLYPTPKGQSHIPLMRLGGLAGWNTPSPLGLGLHPQYGPWSAYRVAWLTNTEQLPKAFYKEPQAFKTTGLTDISDLAHSAELCASCAAPCVTACPANAVAYGENFKIEPCYEHSQPESSECHNHCFARTACPIGAEYRYDDDQLAHHMMMRWR